MKSSVAARGRRRTRRAESLCFSEIPADTGQVHSISDGYQGVSYTQGNWFIMKTREGESLNRWEVFEAFNDAAQESALLGFMADYTAYTDIFEEVSGIYEKYYSALITGTVDPEIYVSRMNRELSEAGLDLLQQELQRQIDHWLAAHPASGALSDLDG